MHHIHFTICIVTLALTYNTLTAWAWVARKSLLEWKSIFITRSDVLLPMFICENWLLTCTMHHALQWMNRYSYFDWGAKVRENRNYFQIIINFFCVCALEIRWRWTTTATTRLYRSFITFPVLRIAMTKCTNEMEVEMKKHMSERNKTKKRRNKSNTETITMHFVCPHLRSIFIYMCTCVAHI